MHNEMLGGATVHALLHNSPQVSVTVAGSSREEETRALMA